MKARNRQPHARHVETGAAPAPAPRARAAPHALFPATPEAGACVELNALLSRLRAGDAALLLAEANRQKALGAELARRGMPGAEECAVRSLIMASAGSIAQGREP